MTLISRISQDIQVPEEQVAAVLNLLDQGATIPFIARYRKEKTGSLDEVAISRIRDRQQTLAALDARKAAILKSLSERDLLTPELEKTIQNAATLAALEDRYEKVPAPAQDKGNDGQRTGAGSFGRSTAGPVSGNKYQRGGRTVCES